MRLVASACGLLACQVVSAGSPAHDGESKAIEFDYKLRTGEGVLRFESDSVVIVMLVHG